MLLALVVLLLCFFLFGAEAYAADIRVLLSSAANGVSLRIIEGEYDIYDLSSGSVDTVEPGDVISVSHYGGELELLINGMSAASSSRGFVIEPYDVEDGVFSYGSGQYRGALRLEPVSGNVMAINVVDIEKYLYSVVGKEIGYGVGKEALKAQAVASRSYALASISSVARYDVTATTSSQVYGGYLAELVNGAQAVMDAVDSTAGEVLYYRSGSKGEIIVPAFFHSNAGGHTEDIDKAWSGSAAIPLKGVPSPEDSYALNSAPNAYQWEVPFTPEEFEAIARKAGKDIGEFVELEMETSPVSGRLLRLEIVGTKGSAVSNKDSIRSFLGGLRSTLFTVNQGAGDGSVWLMDASGTLYESSTDAVLMGAGTDGIASEVNEGKGNFYAVSKSGKTRLGGTTMASDGQIIISGYGYGHGVGMSQWGAIGMAAKGYDYEEILLHYYTTGVDGEIYLGTV